MVSFVVLFWVLLVGFVLGCLLSVFGLALWSAFVAFGSGFYIWLAGLVSCCVWAAWPSGLRRQLQALVRKGASSNLAAVIWCFVRPSVIQNRDTFVFHFSHSAIV